MSIEGAARLLAEARRTGTRLDALPEHMQPADLAEAHAVQDATAALLRDDIAGWKVAVRPDGTVMRGAILRSVALRSPAVLPAARMPLLGIEGEIAFRFERNLPPRVQAYGEAEVAEAVTAFVAIEVVDSRFTSYANTPLLHRTADCMSNGALVQGTARPDWRGTDLAALDATLRVNGAVVVQGRGGHVAGHPLGPAVPLVNALRREGGVRQGQFITTGTFTGLRYVQPGDHVAVAFGGFGVAELHLTT